MQLPVGVEFWDPLELFDCWHRIYFLFFHTLTTSFLCSKPLQRAESRELGKDET